MTAVIADVPAEKAGADAETNFFHENLPFAHRGSPNLMD
jgi:hypothetical protein